MVIRHHELQIPVGPVRLRASLSFADSADAIVVFSHGTGSSRFSSRNRYVANVLQKAGFSTLLFDLLTVDEDRDYTRRFNIPLLTGRLSSVREWLKKQPELSRAPVGYFGASTGAASALWAAGESGDDISAVVSRGGRPDLALPVLPTVTAPTLFLVGSLDVEVISLNEKAFAALRCEKKLMVVEGASHLFEEPGKLEEVAAYASEWFLRYLTPVLAHKGR